MQIEDTVGHAAGDVELLGGSEVAVLTVENPVCVAIDAEDGFVVVAMEVRDERLRVGRDGQLVEVEGALGFVSAFEKGDAGGRRFFVGGVHSIFL